MNPFPGAAAPPPDPLGKKNRNGSPTGTAVGPSDGRLAAVRQSSNYRSTTVRRPSEDHPNTVQRLSNGRPMEKTLGACINLSLYC